MKTARRGSAGSSTSVDNGDRGGGLHALTTACPTRRFRTTSPGDFTGGAEQRDPRATTLGAEADRCSGLGQHGDQCIAEIRASGGIVFTISEISCHSWECCVYAGTKKLLLLMFFMVL